MSNYRLVPRVVRRRDRHSAMRRRLASLTLIVMAVSALVAASDGLSNHTKDTVGAELLPDLRTLKPANFSIQSSKQGNRPSQAGGGSSEQRLLFDNEVMNLHTGPLEVVPTNEKCTTGQGAEGRIALQRIYLDADGDGGFLRNVDSSYVDRLAGCMTFHALHHHWHFDDFALFELRDSSGVVAASSKMTFCIADVNRRTEYFTADNELEKFSPTSEYYDQCNRNSPQGLSVGWGDLYPNGTTGQYIDVTSVSDGTYCFISTADPLAKLAEDNNSADAEANNAASVSIQLDTDSSGSRQVAIVGDC